MQQILHMGFFQVIEKILQVTSESSEINLAILKFIGELIENKGSRLPKSSSIISKKNLSYFNFLGDIRNALLSFALKVTRHIGQNTNLNSETVSSSQKAFKVIPFIAKVYLGITEYLGDFSGVD